MSAGSERDLEDAFLRLPYFLLPAETLCPFQPGTSLVALKSLALTPPVLRYNQRHWRESCNDCAFLRHCCVFLFPWPR